MPNTETQLETFKTFYPQLPQVQALTQADVDKLPQPVDWNAVTPADLIPGSGKRADKCEEAVAKVIFDAICLAIGAVGLHDSVDKSTIDAIVNEIGDPEVQSTIKDIIAEMGDPSAEDVNLAYGVFKLLVALADNGLLDAVFDAFTNNLTWYNAILYTVSGLAELTAAVATEGAALVAEVIVLLADAAFLAEDISEAIISCAIETKTPPAPVQPAKGKHYKPSIAVRTCNGHNYITMVNNGGISDQGSWPIASNREKAGPWERFTLVPVDMADNTFALRTANGHYVTAVNGGGMPGTKWWAVATDRTEHNAWEDLVLLHYPSSAAGDRQYAICTTDGYYVTAVGAGGIEGPPEWPIATNRTERRTWETFTFVSV